MKFLRYFAVSAFIITLTAFSAAAATFTVTKIEDTNDGVCDTDCSFREAVGAANAAAGDDVIEFSSLFDTPQTIVLSGSEIVIVNNGQLTITGPGAGLLTLNGNNASRIIRNTSASVATITDITFTGGNGVSTVTNNSGGAILNDAGNLTLVRVVVNGNSCSSSAGGIRNSGTGSQMTIHESIISNNTSTGSSAGGVQNFSTSTITVTNSLFTGNLSGGGTVGGGAMQLNGTARITNSTFSGNTSNTTGGGGALNVNGSAITLTNVTISGNNAPNNGGGIHRGSTNVNFYMRNSIVAGNNGTAASPDFTNSAAGNSSQGNNIIGVTGTSTGWVKSDLLDTNPMLGPLGDNGGPTLTFLPMAGSPAIDGGQNCVLDSSCSANNPPANVTTDQRGIARPQGANVDIGSVEVESAQSSATITGRVVTPSGRPVSEAIITMTSAPPPTFSGIPSLAFQTRGSTLGSFIFESIPTGETYQVTAFARGYTFPVQNVQVTGDISNLVITASSESFQK